MQAYFVGAGSTLGTLSHRSIPPPIAAGFGKAIDGICNWKYSYPDLEKIAHHLGKPLAELGLEAIWSCMDYYAKLHCALPRKSPWDPGSQDLKKALLRLYGRSCDEAADLLPDGETYTLGQIVKKRIQGGDILISFNYDTVVEKLAMKLGHQLRMVHSGNCPDDVVQLAKPHGSTSWCMYSNCRYLFSKEEDGRPLIRSLAEEDITSQREPLMLGAVPIKSELIREVQDKYCWGVVFETIMRQWQAIVTAVRCADTFIVLGYSFPQEDQYGRFLFQEGMRLRDKNDPPRVEFYELEEHAPKTAKSIFETFSTPGIKVSYCGPVTSPHSR